MKLIKMKIENFQKYIDTMLPDYAEEKVKAGAWNKEEAMKKANENFAQLLPYGINTKNHYFNVLLEEDINREVGYMWFHVTQNLSGKEAFIYDFSIHEEFRGKGYGKKAMKALEDKAREMRLNKILLHVFGHNTRAFELYKKVGYQVTDINMSLDLTNSIKS